MREKLFVENLWQMCGLKKEWNNLHLLQQIFEYHLKKRTKSDVNWMGFIENWKNQQSEIIELRTSLMHLYGSEYQMKSHQCEFEFWTRSISSSDTIMSARKYVRIHGPGAERVENPIFTRTTIPREKLDQMQQ
ncbi:unnamed protein product [Rhizophagus irregularis]|nr:unnamed protein product [Rhizophagus irregularis]